METKKYRPTSVLIDQIGATNKPIGRSAKNGYSGLYIFIIFQIEIFCRDFHAVGVITAVSRALQVTNALLLTVFSKWIFFSTILFIFYWIFRHFLLRVRVLVFIYTVFLIIFLTPVTLFTII